MPSRTLIPQHGNGIDPLSLRNRPRRSTRSRRLTVDCLEERVFLDGSFDPSFGLDGRLTYLFEEGRINEGRDLAIQGDGKVVVVGSTNDFYGVRGTVLRFHPDGTLDETFGAQGIASTDATLTSVAIQTDGRILIAGTTGGTITALRLEADGSIDSSFGTDGMVSVARAGTVAGVANDVTILPDGRIAMAGQIGLSGTLTDNAFIAVMLNSQGVLDPNFGTGDHGDGVTIVNVQTGRADQANALAALPDGRIVLAGTANTANGGNDFAAVMLTAEGVPDTTFNVDGTTIVPFDLVANGDDRAEGVALLPDNRIVLAGRARASGNVQHFAVAVLGLNGVLDTTFGGDGRVEFDFGDVGNSTPRRGVAVDDLGRIVLTGPAQESGDGTEGIGVARLLNDGSFDPNFDTDGRVIIPAGLALSLFDRRSIGQAVAIDANGSIVIGGEVDSDFAVARLLTDGQMDSSFGTNGLVQFNNGTSLTESGAESFVVQPDGKLVVVGSVDAGAFRLFGISRFLPDGSFDETFGDQGQVALRVSTAGDRGPTGVALQSDGGILVISRVESTFVLARLNPDGSLTEDFGDGGMLRLELDDPIFVESMSGIAVLPDDRILVIGSGYANASADLEEFLVVRLQPDGTLDTSYAGGTGVAAIGADDDIFPTRGFVVLPDGGLILSGSVFSSDPGSFRDFVVARLDADGLPVSTFGTDGSQTIGFNLIDLDEFIDAEDLAQAVTVLPDGRILVAGEADTLSGWISAAAMLLPDGSLDESFGEDGKRTFEAELPYGIFGTTVDASGRIYLAGEAEGLPGAFGILRIFSDGSIDTTFGEDGLFRIPFDNVPSWANPQAIGFDPEGRLIVTGRGRGGPRTEGMFAVARMYVDPASILQVGPVDPALRNTPVDSVEVAFSAPIDLQSFTFANLSLARNGQEIPLDDSLTITSVSGTTATYRVSGLTTLTEAEGTYLLTVDASGIEDSGGTAAIGQVETTFTVDTTAPGIAQIEQISPEPRVTPVDSIQVTFSEAIDPATFTVDALSLTRHGDPVPLGNGLTITLVAGTDATFLIEGLGPFTSIPGVYVLTVDGTDMRDPAGNDGVGSLAVSFTVRSSDPDFGDYEGDGLANFAGYSLDPVTGIGTFHIRLADGSSRRESVSGLSEQDIPISGDFDGDGITDLAIVQPLARINGSSVPNASAWVIIRSTDGQRVEIPFGAPGTLDRPAPADFDGDGITDIATFRANSDLTPGAAEWFILPSGGGSAFRVAFGAAGGSDLPAPFDFDGDGRAEIATFRPVSDLVPGAAQWFILPSTQNDERFSERRGAFPVTFGAAGNADQPVVTDFNGDGRDDIAAFRSVTDQPDGSRWFILPSSGSSPAFGSGFPAVFGQDDDIPVIGDYNGDGRPDFAVYSPGSSQFRTASANTNGRPSGEVRTWQIDTGGKSIVPVRSPLFFRLLYTGNVDPATPLGSGIGSAVAARGMGPILPSLLDAALDDLADEG